MHSAARHAIVFLRLLIAGSIKKEAVMGKDKDKGKEKKKKKEKKEKK